MEKLSAGILSSPLTNASNFPLSFSKEYSKFNKYVSLSFQKQKQNVLLLLELLSQLK